MLQRMIVSLVGFYFFAMGYVYMTQDDQVFNAKMLVVKEQKIEGEGIEALVFNVDGAKLQGLERKSGNNAPLILYFSGNADDAREFIRATRSLAGYDMIALNYRGYVDSSGKPSEKALYKDALAQYDAFGRGKEVVLVGRSLGAGVAAYVASQREVKGVVLITPYDSILSIAKQKYPYFPIDILLKHPFEAVKYVQNVKASIAVMEVDNDTTIPRYHLEELLKKMPKTPYHVTLFNTTHGDVLEHPSFNKELQTLLGKIRE